MKKRNFNKGMKIGLLILFIFIGIILIFYFYLISQFKINNVVYDNEKGLGKIKGISINGEYLVQWQDSSFSRETLSSLKGKKELGINMLKSASENKKNPEYFFYASDNEKKAVVLSNYSGEAVISPDIIPSYEEKGMFVWKTGKKDCKPDFICEDWVECKSTYGLNSILSGELVLGTKSRNCRDYADCFSDFTEYADCEIKEGIFTKKVNIGNKDYLEVYNSKNSLVARLELLNETYKKLNIQIITDESAYYPYCYDNIKDYDEDEIDCVYEENGHCPVCK